MLQRLISFIMQKHFERQQRLRFAKLMNTCNSVSEVKNERNKSKNVG